ncbi:MAG: cell division protein FtsQ/DivIB [Alphaproteobacteria bacterium]
MRKRKTPRLRGSVTQNNMSVRMRAREQTGLGFLTRLGILAGGVLVLVGGVALLWHYDWPQNQARRAEESGLEITQKAQFSVKDITVEGRHQSNSADITDALGTERGAAILDFDTKAAAARLGKLPWVETAVVERRLPDTIAVILTERIPAARWQHDDKTTVIDTEGHVLPAAKPDDFAALPLVVGVGADHEAGAFLSLLKNYPDIRDKTDSIVRVGDRRWDLHLRPKVTAKLPEQDVDTALHRLSVLITQEKILDRDIVAVDLRLPDRLVFEPATTARQGALHK